MRLVPLISTFGDTRVQFGDDLTLLSASRSGSSAASQRVVRRYQAELIRAGYLLTGTSGRAAALARDTFLRFFEELMRGNEGDDAREQLLATMARLHIANPSRGELSLSKQPFIPTGGPTRYAVDDQRKRVMSALERLDVQERAALVLREFNAFDEEATSRVFNRPPHDLRAMLHPARTRVRDMAGASESQSVRELLTNAASDATLVELWPELEEPLERLLAQEEVKRKRMVAGAGIAVGLVVLAVAIWLTGFSPFGSDGDGSRAGAASVTTTSDVATSTTSPEPTSPPTPTADLSALQTPPGDVPDRLLMTYEVRSETGPNQRRQAFYDPAAGEVQPIEIPGETADAAASQVSADGRWLIYYRFSTGGNGRSGFPIGLTAVSSETGAVAWEREISEFQEVAFAGGYLVLLTDGDPDTLAVIDVATGATVVERSDFLEGIEVVNDGGPMFYRLLGSSDGSRLFMLMWEESSIGIPARNQVLATYNLPDLNLEDSMVRANTAGDGRFDDDFQFYQAGVTPDGRAIYVPGNGRVQFLSTESPDPVTVELPFTPLPPESPLDFQWATSNDGRYLYGISQIRKQVAVVDLLSQSVSRAFPLDQGEFTLVPQSDDDGLNEPLVNWRASVSPNGRTLLLVGAWEDPTRPVEDYESSIWLIDVETWRVTGRLVVYGQAANVLFTSVDNQAVVYSVFRRSNSALDQEQTVTTFDLGSGQAVAQTSPTAEALAGASSQVQWILSEEFIYRDAHHRVPSIAGVVPQTVETVSTLPRFNLTPAVSSVPNGGNVQLVLQVLDPATGGPLETAAQDVRFDPNSNPVLVLRQQDGDGELILVPSRTSPAEYSAATPVEGGGYWDVEIQFTTTDGQGASVTFPSLFEVTPSVPSMEGPRYSLRIETPSEPAVREEVLVRASFVDIETGSVLPEGTDLRGGLPDELTATFYHAEYGFFTESLTQTRHGVYEGPATFRGAGAWQVEVSFWSEELGQSVKISGGTVEVQPAGP